MKPEEIKIREFYKSFYNEHWHFKNEEDMKAKKFDYYDLIEFALAYNNSTKQALQ